jgi:uncharacterized protein YjbJ (UPF0337 family)
MGAMMDKAKGRLKKIEGKVTGDKVRTAQGSVEEGVGDVELEGGSAVDNVKAGVSRAKAKIKSGLAGAGRRTRRR